MIWRKQNWSCYKSQTLSLYVLLQNTRSKGDQKVVGCGINSYSKFTSNGLDQILCLVCEMQFSQTCGDRTCGAGYAPRFQNFECEQCEVDRLEAERILRESELENQSPYNQIKKCPACQVPTIRYSGCNHITCQCGAHWCFECGGEFNPSIIYTHINRADGRIYANEEPEFFEGYE